MFLFTSKRMEYDEISPSDKSKYSALFLFVSVFGFGVLSLVGIASMRRDVDGPITLTQGNELTEFLVTLENGEVRGKNFTSRDGRPFLGFLGIPFAKPPIGELRFAPPEEPDSWDGVRDATEYKSQCIQLYKNKTTGNVSVFGSEDCLYLNVFTPKTMSELSNRRKRLPVIFFIHGGIQNGNGSLWGPDYFMDEDVVLVLVQYRLHVFGTLNTGDSLVRGNLQSKDIVQALKWVQGNIGYFGGNKRKITLYGMSYGSMLTSVQLISPMSKGLFHQAIMESGTLLYRTYVVKDPRKLANELADMINCPRNNTQELVDCFRRTDAGLLTLAVQDLNFGFTVEYPSSNPDADTCIPDEPMKLLEAGKINGVPTICGVASAENLATSIPILLSSESVPEDEKNEYLAQLLQLEFAKDSNSITEKLRNFYFNRFNLTRDELLHNFTNLFSDRDYIHPMSTFLKFQLTSQAQRNNPIFLYFFTKESNNSFASSSKELWGETEIPFGVSHADDIQYFFPSKKFPFINPQSSFYNFSKQMVKFWVNFAENGKPTGRRDEIEWEQLNSVRNRDDVVLNWFELNDQPRMFTPYGVEERIKLWDSFNMTELYI